MLVQSNDAADDRRIVLKMRMPVAVTQHDVGHAVGAMLVGGMEKPAHVRLNPQCVEIIPGDRLGPGARRIVAGVEADLREAECGEIIEGAVAIAEVDVIGIGLRARFVGPALDLVETVGVGHIERAQDEGVQNAEHDRGRADAQGQRRCGSARESGRLAQQTHAEAQILRERVDERDAHRLPAFLLEPLVAAELEARPALGAGAIDAGSLEIVGAVLDMGAELLVHVVLDARTMKQGGDGTNER